MTERKSFKRQVRSRMAKTGERYAAARRQMLAGRDSAFDPDAFGLVSDATVAARTGRTWREWFAVLDDEGAAERTHTEIARHLSEEHGVPGWWAQTVTVGYERARAKRALYQQPDGFSVSVSRTVAVPVERLFEAVVAPAWPELRLRTAQTGRSARFDWEDGATRVIVGFTAKGEAKSTVALAHERLADAGAAQAAKAARRARLDELKGTLEQA
jgi:hypothetical protein